MTASASTTATAPAPDPFSLLLIPGMVGGVATNLGLLEAIAASAENKAGMEPESSKFVSAQLRKGTRAEFDAACRS